MSTSPTLPPKANPMQEIRDFLADKSETAIVRHLLGYPIPGAPALLDSAILICIDCESWEVKTAGDFLTEVGLATFDSRDLRQLPSPGPHAENILKHVYYYHKRLTKNAHMVNQKWCRGNPENNRFGRTRFVTEEQLASFLNDCFSWPIQPEDPKAGVCPVVFLGHAVKNDLKMLSDAGLSTSSNVVATIDTQHLARAAAISSTPISLATLCSYHGFKNRDAHTASNDAAYTIICCLLTVLAPELAPLNQGSNKTAQDVVDQVESNRVVHVQSTFGIPNHCTRCTSLEHRVRQCRAQVECENCKAVGNMGKARTHRTDMCLTTLSNKARAAAWEDDDDLVI